ncbi:CinA family protein [Bordetella bronchiseptica]
MNALQRTALYMQEQRLTLVTAESCTAGLIASLLAEEPGAGALLDCAYVVYSPQAKTRCLGVAPDMLRRHNLTSEAVARAMALGAARHSDANVAIANTGVADEPADGTPAGTQCYAWLFKAGPADAQPTVYTETARFDGARNTIRRDSARYALQRLPHYHALWRAAGNPEPSTMKPTPTSHDRKQDDDTEREAQRSHGSQQSRTKKDGHVSQIGSNQDQSSQRNRGQGARRS